jgi:hypothetical protein
MKHALPRIMLIALLGVMSTSAFTPESVEKVDIYLGHFLLQTWPQAHRTINIEVDPAFPPDTLVFHAVGTKGGINRAVLEIKDMSGANTIQQLGCVRCNEEETDASFIYVLNQDNLSKIKEQGFRVVLNKHHDNGTEVRNMALIMLDKKEPTAVTDADALISSH